MCELQQGATVSFSEDGTFGIISIDEFSAPIPVIDDTDLAATVSRKKCPGQLRDPQAFNIVMRNIGNEIRPTVGLIQDLTITRPIPPGYAGTPEILDGSGFITDVTEPAHNSDSEARQTITVTWQYNGNPIPARTLASLTQIA